MQEPAAGPRRREAGWAYLANALWMRPVIALLFRLRTAGRLPAHGPVILAPNHVSYLDPLLVAVAAWVHHRPVRFLIARGVFEHPIAGPVVTAARQIPVDPQAGREALVPALAALERGEVLVVYPEGGIPAPGERRPARLGVARLARRSGAPVVPVATHGADRMGSWWQTLRRRRAGVVFGAQMQPASDEDDRDFAERVLASVRALAPRAVQLAGR